jgi:hypothetical protein
VRHDTAARACLGGCGSATCVYVCVCMRVCMLRAPRYSCLGGCRSVSCVCAYIKHTLQHHSLRFTTTYHSLQFGDARGVCLDCAFRCRNKPAHDALRIQNISRRLSHVCMYVCMYACMYVCVCMSCMPCVYIGT